jgi:hypothetical protein
MLMSLKRLGSGFIKVDLEKGAEKEVTKNVEIIMDASNSMWGQIGDEVKLKEGAYTLRILLAPQPLEIKVQVKAGGRTACVLKKESGAWKLGC